MTLNERFKGALVATLLDQFKIAKSQGFTDEDNQTFAAGFLAGVALSGNFLAAQDGEATPSMIEKAAREIANDMGLQGF